MSAICYNYPTRQKNIELDNGEMLDEYTLVVKEYEHEKLIFLYNEINIISEILSKLPKYKKIKIRKLFYSIIKLFAR